ncbi:MAG: RNA methyltransferase [Candidatus Thorarchaeota archaeon]|nr:RNA methyltransferase [Candidatus Thorarchaeota archaeon]
MTEFPNIVVVLVEPENPGNVGFAARVLANFGVDKLKIVGCDPREDYQAQIFSVHAHTILDSAQIVPDLETALEDTDVAWGATARAGGNHSVTRALVPLQKLPDPTAIEGRIALVFGRESKGLTNEEIVLCDLVFTIPTSEEYPSMNLSHAVSVVLYHLFSQYATKKGREPNETRSATREERAQVMVFLDEVIDNLSIKDFRKPIAKQIFRNILGRSYITGREITTLTGIARKLNDLVKMCDESED